MDFGIQFEETDNDKIMKIGYKECSKKFILLNRITRQWIIKDAGSSLEKEEKEYLDFYKDKQTLLSSYYSQIPENYKNAYFNLTYKCNLNCPLCYASKKNYDKLIEPEFQELEIIIDNLKKKGIENICLIGGEPFVSKHFTDFIILLRKRNFRSIRIDTNGTKIHNYNPDFYLKNMVSLQISLDSIDEKINSLTRPNVNIKKLIENIIRYHKSGVKLKVMGTITKDNYNTALDMYTFFMNQGIPCGFFQLKDNGIGSLSKKLTLKEISELFDKIYEYHEGQLFHTLQSIKVVDNLFFFKIGFPVLHCGAGVDTVVVNPDGKIYPCVKLIEPEYCIGNLEKNRITQNHKKIPFVDDLPVCKDCYYRYLCGGGCRTQQYYLDKNFEKKPDCDLYIGMLKYFYSKIFQKCA